MSAPSLAALPAGLIPDDAPVRVRVLIGEDADSARRADKTVIARSDCRYYCPDAATVARCIEALRDSDARLRGRAEELMLWDWECTYFEPDPEDDVRHRLRYGSYRGRARVSPVTTAARHPCGTSPTGVLYQEPAMLAEMTALCLVPGWRFVLLRAVARSACGPGRVRAW
jgi:hypothetical protein